MARSAVAIALPPAELEAVSAQLTEAGYETIPVATADELEKLLGLRSDIGVAILDSEYDFDKTIEMYGLLHEGGRAIPALMVVSTKALDRMGLAGKARVADEYFTRPYSAESLRWRVEAMLIRAEVPAGESAGTFIESAPPAPSAPPEATYAPPEAAPTYQTPVPAPTYQTPVPAPTYQTPVPAPTYQTPTYQTPTYPSPVPAPAYQAPAYEPPAPAYEPPAPAYEPPAPAYEPPAPAYEPPAPAPTYQTPTYQSPSYTPEPAPAPAYEPTYQQPSFDTPSYTPEPAPAYEQTYQQPSFDAPSYTPAPAPGADLPQGQIVIVFNPKGGVGKTTIAVNTAAMLQVRKGQRVLLVDCDTVTGHVGSSLGLERIRSVADAWTEDLQSGVNETFAEIAIQHSSGVYVLVMAESPLHTEILEPRRVAEAITAARQVFDWVVIDMHPDYGPLNQVIFERADRILVPVTPDVPAIRAAVQFREVAVELGIRDRLAMVVNRANSGVSVGDMERTVGIPALAEVRSAGMLFVRAANEGRSAVERFPKEKVIDDFEVLADRMIKTAEHSAARRGEGFLDTFSHISNTSIRAS